PAGPGRRRAWPGRRCLAASPARGALPGRPRLPRRPRNGGRRSWYRRYRQLLVPAASYLARTSAASSIPAASAHDMFPDAALAPATFLPRQLFEAPPPGPRLPSPLRHERRQEGTSHAGSVFPGAGRKAQAPSFSEPTQLPSHQVQKRSVEAAASTLDYLSSSKMPFSDPWSPTPTADYTMQVCHTEKFQAVYEAMKQSQGKRQSKSTATPSQQEAHEAMSRAAEGTLRKLNL
ncbi:unnamed protein product, partial [Urochloa humidicola]